MMDTISNRVHQNTEFYMTICACSSTCVEHRSKHNALVAHRIAEILTEAGGTSKAACLNASSCCMPYASDGFLDHTKHYVIVGVSISLLNRCLAVVNQCESITLAEDDQLPNHKALSNLTPGQLTWLGSMALRMVSLSDAQVSLLHHLKSCETYEDTVSVFATPTGTNTRAIFCLSNAELTKAISPLHDLEARAEVSKLSHPWLCVPFPCVDRLRWYLGDSTGYYFAWLYFYALALLVPASTGIFSWLLCFILDYLPLTSKDEETEEVSDAQSPLSIFRLYYGLATIIWAIACIKVWKRQQAQLAEDWLSPVLSGATDLAYIHGPNDVRPQFKGTLRMSPVTGERELHFPAYERRLLYLMTGSISLVCVSLAILINVILMNLEGFVRIDRSPHIYFRCISCWTEPGGIFDPIGGGYLSYFPSILHPLLIFVMNQIVFRQIAERLTDLENHRTQADWDQSLIVKRFLFEAVDAYVCPAYLGFVLVDWSALQSMLTTIFATDTVRRLACECLLPWMSYQWRSHRDRVRAAAQKKLAGIDGVGVQSSSMRPTGSRDHVAQFGVPYEPFDDFLEMVLEHGYIVLFSVAAPPTLACMALVCAFAEGYTDALKLLHIVRRPISEPLSPRVNENIWLTLLACQAWLGIFTNVGLLACRTDWSLSALLILEHILLFIGLSIEMGIDDTPIRAKESFRARTYRRYKLFTQVISTKT